MKRLPKLTRLGIALLVVTVALVAVASCGGGRKASVAGGADLKALMLALSLIHI